MKDDVLIVASEFPPGPGGIGSHAYSMAKGFCAHGIKVTVIANADYVTVKQATDFDKNQSFTIIRYPSGGMAKYIKRFMLVHKYAKGNVIFSGWFSLLIGLWINLVKRDIHSICILHGTEVNVSNPILRELTHMAINSFDVIVAVSNFTKHLLPDWILKKREVHVVPNGIDLSGFKETDETIELKGEPILLTVGNVTPRKGQHRVIKALPSILKRYPDAHYHIVGLPSYKEQFEKLAENIGVSHAITFHGRAAKFEDIFKYYKSADIFIILSENQSNGDCEGFGIVVLEAGYYDLPTIGAKGCGIADAVSNDYNGYLVDGDSGDEVADAITKILSNKERLKVGAKQWAKEHDWNIIIIDLIKLLEQ